MREMIILRGASGSGKSELAKLLIALTAMQDGMTYGSEAVICSADRFFGIGDNYKFDPKKLGTAHRWCQNEAYHACYLGTKLVIVDNTHTQRWEFQPYLDMAEEFGYKVIVIEVQGNHQNIHQVPEASVQKQHDRFQHDWWNHPEDK